MKAGWGSGAGPRITRREFSKRLAAASGGLLALARAGRARAAALASGTTAASASALAPRAEASPARDQKGPDAIEARLEGTVLHLEYRLSPRSTAALAAARRASAPRRTTFITAVRAVSSRPLFCRALASLPGSVVTGPSAAKGKTGSKTGGKTGGKTGNTTGAIVSYRARVDLGLLPELAGGGGPILIHASFWQHRSGVLVFGAGA